MIRISLTRFAVLLSAYAWSGCAGQNVEGAWIGGFPTADSKDCVIRLQDNHQGSISCKDTALLSLFRYDWDGRILRLGMKMLSVGKHIVKPGKPYEFAVSGKGNEMVLTRNDSTYRWVRRGL